MNKPVKNIRIGRISAAIWANTNEHGTFYSVTFERAYRQGQEWKSTNSFGRDDLLVLAKIADMAHTWIAQALQRRNEQAAPKQASESDVAPEEADVIPF